jgi:hypothetical protein
MDFGVHPAPLPTDTEISDFMKWIDTEFKALPGVISSVSDFAAAFLVESILKLLHDFDCADLVRFREKLSQFHDASRTSRLHPNEDVLAIKAKFAREFWFASGKEVVKNIARTKLDQVVFFENAVGFCKFANFLSLFFLDSFVCSLQLIEEEKRGKGIEAPEPSSEDEDNEDTDNAEEDSGKDGGDSSSSGDVEDSSDHKESSLKVDITC